MWNLLSFLSKITLVLVLGFLAGCSQPLQTLMAVGSEQKAQQGVVARERAFFKALLRDVQNHRLETGTTRSDIIARYGEPILAKDHTVLYRDPVDFLNSPKVYLVFDEADTLLDIKMETKDGQ